MEVGYQSWDQEFYEGVILDKYIGLLRTLRIEDPESLCYLYTNHLVFYEDGILKQTRSSPNWDGGIVTYATCKHLMRTYRDDWTGVWIAGLCPKRDCDNCVLFVGKVTEQFSSNMSLRRRLQKHPRVLRAKMADRNPRGDIYTPVKKINCYSHTSYSAPEGHTRSVEYYDRSPGSTSERPDGKIPKWWRDVEYIYNGRRPKSFVFGTCCLFSRPMVWTTLVPGRAALKITIGELLESLTKKNPHR